MRIEEFNAFNEFLACIKNVIGFADIIGSA